METTRWDKVAYVPRQALALAAARQFRSALQFALADCRRTEITMEELTSLTWMWRAKSSAGYGGTIVDPWHRGRPSWCTGWSSGGRRSSQPEKQPSSC